MLLEGKRTIIVGGAKGIAAETVRTFVREGAGVASLDVDDVNGKETASGARDLGAGPVDYYHCDITNQDEVNEVLGRAVEKLGGLDCMVVTAGLEQQKAAEDLVESDIDTIFRVNVHGTMYCCAAAYNHMKGNGGSIVTYTSGSGLDGFPEMPVYSASKGAVVAYVRTIAKDWGKHGIRVNTIAPAVMTPLSEEFLAEMDPQRRKMMDDWFAEKVSLGGKMGKPSDAADVNLFFASDLSRFITAQTVPVDGGYTVVR
jgi:NAD(P)-dependent dehydrogenase (short-subunit alcohol dehydrogenase family)